MLRQERNMFGWRSTALLITHVCCAVLLGDSEAHAQNRLVIKNGETVELHLVFYIASCRSIMVGLPQVEMIEGPPEVTLSIKEGEVVPRERNCAKPVAGGTLMATA